jgi:hypothetical protein
MRVAHSSAVAAIRDGFEEGDQIGVGAEINGWRSALVHREGAGHASKPGDDGIAKGGLNRLSGDPGQGADVCLTIKDNQRTLRSQVAFHFDGKRCIPFVAMDHEKRHGRDTLWTLRAKEASEHSKTHWPGCTWIVTLITDRITCKGKRELRQHLYGLPPTTSTSPACE